MVEKGITLRRLGDFKRELDEAFESASNKEQVLSNSSTEKYPSSKAVADYVEGKIAYKQDTLTAGEGITISGNTISSTIPIENGEGVNSIVQKDLNNQAISKGTIALGSNNVAGQKGWYYRTINFTPDSQGRYKIYLTSNISERNDGIAQGIADFQLGFKVGDRISFVNDAKYDACSTLVAIDTSYSSIIYVDSLPFSSIVKISAPKYDDYTCFSVDEPNIGIVDLGEGAISLGTSNLVSGKGSFVCGSENESLGNYVHIEGRQNKAVYCSHAEGRYNQALGGTSHAEGYETTTSGKYSHTEGYQTTATERAAHAEGYQTSAQAYSAHSEGTGTIADGGEGVHAEGKESEAHGIAAHSEGQKSKANGAGAHSEGMSTISSGNGSHAEGMSTLTSGNATHAEGFSTSAAKNGNNATGAHAEGRGTSAVATGAHAEGGHDNETNAKFKISSTTDPNVYTYSAGAPKIGIGACILNPNDNIVYNAYIVSYNTTAKTITLSSTLGELLNVNVFFATYAGGTNTHAEGTWTSALGAGSHSEGYGTMAQNKGEHAEGNFNKSNKASTSYGNAGNTQHSIGIGTSDTNRKNAFEVMQNGDVYVKGIGGYDGTNAGATRVLTLQQIINAITT